MTTQDIFKELDYILYYKTPIFRISDKQNNIFVKKEDCIPFSFGGNKCRIAAAYFKDIIKNECDTVVTYGGTSSNLCRIVANFACRYGIASVIVTPDDLCESTCNSELLDYLNAKRVFCQRNNVHDTIDSVMNEYSTKAKPFFIYGGGHGKIGTESYRNVLDQVVEYENETGIQFDLIFITLATGTSMSGLIVENEVKHYDKKLIGISIARNFEKAMSVMNESLAEYGMITEDFIQNHSFKILDNYCCGGYGKFNDTVVETIRSQFVINGLNLDTTYTGKAFWGMLDYLGKNNISNQNVLFIHTGGTPLFFNDGCKYLNYGRGKG